MSAAEVIRARLRPLPLRLRIAHLAALVRCGRLIVRDGYLCYPSSLREESTTAGIRHESRAG
jgi:hypothetical protein